MLRQSFRSSLKNGQPPRPMFAAPCSYGKTIISAYLLKSYQDAGKKAIFICDRIKLVNQSLKAFDSLGLECSVIQAHHERYDREKPIQIASIASLENFQRWPDADVVIIDEAHVLRESIKNKMKEWNMVPFIGLSATPYSKGLGEYFNDLIVPSTPLELLSEGYLCPVEYYGGHKPDLSGVRTKQLTTGARDYSDDGLKKAIEKDEVLAGSIIKNWKLRAEGKMTIAFSPSVKHSKHMVDLFNSEGIPAAHIDGYMTKEQQQDLFDAHSNGEFLILSCSRLLNTGYDESRIECLIDCYPTKSIIQYVQRAGRIMRIADGKEKAIYLDHAGNVRNHGFPEDLVPDSLHQKEEEYKERSLTKKKKEPKVQECPQCFQEMVGIRCKCGYEVPIREQIQTDEQELQKIKEVKQKDWNKVTPKEEKERYYGMLKYYAATKGYKHGWADYRYRARAGVWPNKIKHATPIKPDSKFMESIAA